MAPSVNQICSEIIETVNLSNLDFNMNQTPYSLHFSIRKKFSRAAKENGNPNSPRTNSAEFYVNYGLRQELNNMQIEYEKLLAFCKAESEEKSKLEAELEGASKVQSDLMSKLSRAYRELEAKEQHEKNDKKVKFEMKTLNENLASKCLELKQLKQEIEANKKEKNCLSVALKGSRQETKEVAKDFKKEKLIYDKKIVELVDFKNKKVFEEREEKLQKKKRN